MRLSPCPTCGGVLERLQDALASILMAPALFVRGQRETYITLQPRPVVACTECEYVEVSR